MVSTRSQPGGQPRRRRARTRAETRRAHEAETQAAALAERARIARDLHDVLAHSLAAVSVNLQGVGNVISDGGDLGDMPAMAG